MLIQRIALIVFLGIAAGCVQKTADFSSDDNMLEDMGPLNRFSVKVTPVKKGDFTKKILTNGILKARRKWDIKASKDGEIIASNLVPGIEVRAGDTLIILDSKDHQLIIEQNILTLAEAEVSKADLFIANEGLAFKDSTIGADKLKLINTISGYDKAIHALKKSRLELEKYTICAPFTGVIADVNVQIHSSVNSSTILGSLIDKSSFVAEFYLMEEDALKIEIGQMVVMFATAKPRLKLSGKVQAVNPVVDKNGLVCIQAKIDNPPSSVFLFDGMQLSIELNDFDSNQLFIPKSAIVIRSGKKVVFTLSPENQIAKWNYVETANENDEDIVITSGLRHGDLVIVEGNLNLDENSMVRVDQ